MNVRKDRKKLELELHKVLLDINTNKNIKETVTNIMKERHNYTAGESRRILNESIQIEYLNQTELCILNLALYEAIKDTEIANKTNINPEDYFNSPEIIQALQVKKETKEKTNMLVFDNVIQVSDRQWVCVRSLKKLAEDMLSHNVTYNFETQRDPIEKEYNENIIRIPNIMPQKVTAIKSEMKSNTFTPNLISYNVLQLKGDESIFYNQKEKSIVVEIDNYTQCNIVDGCNRLWSIAELVNENPDIEGNMIVNILYYNSEEAKHFIRQEQLAEPISKARQEEYNMNDLNMTLAKEINRYGNQVTNEMFNKIALTPNELKLENKYVTYHVIREAISQNFKFDNPFKANKIREHIVNVMNYVIGYFRERYGDLDKAKEKYEILTNNMFYGYIALAGKTFGQDDWESVVEETLKKIDFSKYNPIWKEIMLESNNIQKRNIRTLIQHFDVVNE
jgi:hypothetical protein